MAAAEHYAERLAAVEANVTDLRGHLNTFAADIEATRRKSLVLIGEKATEIETNSEIAHAKAHELYELANRTSSALAGRVDTLEAKGAAEQYGNPYNQKSLVPAKAMVPTKLAKVDEWKRWKVDLEEYAEASMIHLKEALRLVKAEDGDYGEPWFADRGAPAKMAEDAEDLH